MGRHMRRPLCFMDRADTSAKTHISFTLCGPHRAKCRCWENKTQLKGGRSYRNCLAYAREVRVNRRGQLRCSYCPHLGVATYSFARAIVQRKIAE